MREPARWREANGGASADLRSLLDSNRAVAPSQAEKDRIWSSLAPELASVPSPPCHPVAATGAGSVAAKVTVVALLAAAAGGGWYGLRTHGGPSSLAGRSPETTTKTAPPPVASPTSKLQSVALPSEGAAPAAPARAAEKPTRPRSASTPPLPTRQGPAVRAELTRGVPEEPVTERPLPSSWGPSPWPSPAPASSDPRRGEGQADAPAPPAQVVTNALLEESRRLASARAALRAGDSERALELLAEGTRETAALAQEREALTIEALAAKDQTRAAAVERARAFLRAHPQSPYRARIKAIVFESP